MKDGGFTGTLLLTATSPIFALGAFVWQSTGKTITALSSCMEAGQTNDSGKHQELSHIHLPSLRPPIFTSLSLIQFPSKISNSSSPNQPKFFCISNSSILNQLGEWLRKSFQQQPLYLLSKDWGPVTAPSPSKTPASPWPVVLHPKITHLPHSSWLKSPSHCPLEHDSLGTVVVPWSPDSCCTGWLPERAGSIAFVESQQASTAKEESR